MVSRHCSDAVTSYVRIIHKMGVSTIFTLAFRIITWLPLLWCQSVESMSSTSLCSTAWH